MRAIYVLSHDAVTTEGFEWMDATETNDAAALAFFTAEVAGWGDTPVMVRLVKMEVPDGTEVQVTTWLDENQSAIDDAQAIAGYVHSLYDIQVGAA